MQAQGQASLDLSLILPLENLDRSQVRGTVQLQGNQLQFAPQFPAMSQVRGAFGFTENALFVNAAQAQFLGGSVAIDGKTDDQAVLRLQAKGRASAQGLQSLVDHAVMKGLEGYLDYQAAISLEGQGMDLRLESDGLGLQSRLPSPLAKSAKEAWPIRVEMVPGQRFGGDIALQGIRRDVSNTDPFARRR